MPAACVTAHQATANKRHGQSKPRQKTARVESPLTFAADVEKAPSPVDGTEDDDEKNGEPLTQDQQEELDNLARELLAQLDEEEDEELDPSELNFGAAATRAPVGTSNLPRSLRGKRKAGIKGKELPLASLPKVIPPFASASAGFAARQCQAWKDRLRAGQGTLDFIAHRCIEVMPAIPCLSSALLTAGKSR